MVIDVEEEYEKPTSKSGKKNNFAFHFSLMALQKALIFL